MNKNKLMKRIIKDMEYLTNMVKENRGNEYSIFIFYLNKLEKVAKQLEKLQKNELDKIELQDLEFYYNDENWNELQKIRGGK